MANIGVIYNQTDFSGISLTDFVGPIVATKVGTTLQLDYASGGYKNYFDFRNCFESYRITTNFSINANTTFGVGLKGDQVSSPRAINCVVDTRNNLFALRSSTTILASRPVTIIDTSNVQLYFKKERAKITCVLKADNKVYTIQSSSFTALDTRVGHFSFFMSEGTAFVSSLKFEVLEKTNISFLFIGDSITQGNALAKGEVRFANLYATRKGVLPENFSVHAGGSCKHIDLEGHILTMVRFQNPGNVYILLGDNDDYNDTSSWKPHRDAIISACSGIGVPSTNMTNTPEVVVSGYSLIKDAILANYANVVDLWTPLQSSGDPTLGNPIYYKPDNVHPNQLGNDVIQNQIP